MAPPSGNNMTYRFMPDGTFQQYGLMQFTYATCVNSYFMNITGTYTLRGDELTTTPVDGTFDSRTCGGSQGGNRRRRWCRYTRSGYREMN